MARKKKVNPDTSKPEETANIAGQIDDPENYARMGVPHATDAEAAAAWTAFYKDVYEARKKHRIAEAVIIGQVRWKDENGKMMGANVTGSMGDDASVLRMLAYAYGKTKREYEELLMQLEHGTQKEG